MEKKRKAPPCGNTSGAGKKTTHRQYAPVGEKKQELRRDILFGIVGSVILFGGFFGVMWLHSFLIRVMGG